MKYVIIHNEDESLFERLKSEAQMRLQELKEWVMEHKEAIVILTPVCIKGVTMISRIVIQYANTRKKETIKNEYCYDRSLGHYWRLRRNLSNEEWLEIDRRRKGGERLSDILMQLNVLK